MAGGLSSQLHSFLPHCCLVLSGPEISAPHIPQGPEAGGASSEGGQCPSYSQFFWASFVPLPVAVQFTQRGLKHMTGWVLCSVLGLLYTQRRNQSTEVSQTFPSTRTPPEPRVEENSKYQWDRKGRKGAEKEKAF